MSTPQSSYLAGSALLLYTILSVAGLTLLKQANSVVSLTFLGGAAAYGAGFLIWIFVILRTLPLSVGFPLAAGALILGTQVAGRFALREPINVQHAAGILFILVGIGLVSLEAAR